jgi:hypothetical protein
VQLFLFQKANGLSCRLSFTSSHCYGTFIKKKAVQSTNVDVSLYRVVYDWARYANKDMGTMLNKKNIGKSFALVKSRKFQVLFNGSTPSSVMFEFLARGKFSEMGVGRGQKLGDVKGNQVLYREAGVKGRKSKMWFSNVLFPEANTLARILAEEFAIHSVNMIKESIDSTIK